MGPHSGLSGGQRKKRLHSCTMTGRGYPGPRTGAKKQGACKFCGKCKTVVTCENRGTLSVIGARVSRLGVMRFNNEGYFDACAASVLDTSVYSSTTPPNSVLGQIPVKAKWVVLHGLYRQTTDVPRLRSDLCALVSCYGDMNGGEALRTSAGSYASRLVPFNALRNFTAVQESKGRSTAAKTQLIVASEVRSGIDGRWAALRTCLGG